MSTDLELNTMALVAILRPHTISWKNKASQDCGQILQEPH